MPSTFISTLALLLAATPFTHALPNRKPIIIDRSGGLAVGGRIIIDPLNENLTLHCDHGYIEYFIPATPRRTSIVLWHSSSSQVFQNRWDGGEGYKDIFLRRDYPTYIWDGPRVGRANWACENHSYVVAYRDQSNFPGWNFGPRFGEWWEGIQFPTENKAAWDQATSARYVEFDTLEDVERQSGAMARAIESGRLGEGIVYVTNSAAGLRAQRAVTKVADEASLARVKALVMYESIGSVLPDNVGVENPGGGFGPLTVPEEDFKKLAKVPAVQFVWGDHRAWNESKVEESKLCAALINSFGGNASVLMLGSQEGFKGSTHIPFADMHNAKVADLMESLLQEKGLDAYADESSDQCTGSTVTC